MGEGKSNSDNGNRQNKINQQDEASNYVKKIIAEMNEQYKNSNAGISIDQQLSPSGVTGTCAATNTCNNIDVGTLAAKVTNINILKFELDRLPLDFRSRAYFENDVKPLTDTLTVLSFSSDNYSVAAANLAGTNFGSSSKIKDALDLVDGLNEISDDLIKVLKCKVDNMLRLAKYDCK